jgi:hypothetical protein
MATRQKFLFSVLIFLLTYKSALASPNARAAQSPDLSEYSTATSTPDASIVLDRINFRTDSNYCKSTARSVLANQETAVRTGRLKDQGESRNLVGDIHYDCRAILFRLTTEDHYKSNMFSMERFWLTGVSWTTGQLDVACVPRTYSEKQTLSQYRACETRQDQQCFEPNYMKKLDQVKATQMLYNLKGSCLE